MQTRGRLAGAGRIPKKLSSHVTIFYQPELPTQCDVNAVVNRDRHTIAHYERIFHNRMPSFKCHEIRGFFQE